MDTELHALRRHNAALRRENALLRQTIEAMQNIGKFIAQSIPEPTPVDLPYATVGTGFQRSDDSESPISGSDSASVLSCAGVGSRAYEGAVA